VTDWDFDFMVQRVPGGVENCITVITDKSNLTIMPGDGRIIAVTV
jgi:hypothetical protein